MYLHTVVPGVEEACASDVGQDGVLLVLQHVVSGDWRQAVSLGEGETRQYMCQKSLGVQHEMHQTDRNASLRFQLVKQNRID